MNYLLELINRMVGDEQLTRMLFSGLIGLSVVLVVGSPNSSNSNRLRELAERMKTPAYLIDGAEDLQKSWFDGVQNIGITAGASAPEVLVRGVIQQLHAWGATGADELAGREENITFSMPKELRVRSLL